MNGATDLNLTTTNYTKNFRINNIKEASDDLIRDIIIENDLHENIGGWLVFYRYIV